MLVFCLIHTLLLVLHFSYAYFLTLLNLFHWLLLKLVVILALFTFRLVLFFLYVTHYLIYCSQSALLGLFHLLTFSV
jgi:hypothetical protein